MVVGLTLSLGPIVLADREPPPQDVPGMIAYYSATYDINSAELSKVAKCESGYKKDVYGDGGYAFGVMQFHKQTFDMWSKEMGVDLDYYSSNDAIKLAAWAFAHGPSYKKHWTCWK